MSELHRFILRGQVIALYRSFQRAIKQAPPDSKGRRGGTHRAAAGLPASSPAASRPLTIAMRRGGPPAADIHREVRRQFEQHRSAPDAYAIKYLLSDGRVQLKQLNEMIGLRA